MTWCSTGGVEPLQDGFDPCVRHKAGAARLKRWNKPGTIQGRLPRLNALLCCRLCGEDIRRTADPRPGWRGRTPALSDQKEDRPDLAGPLSDFP